jgi:signal transduction histidine kinase
MRLPFPLILGAWLLLGLVDSAQGLVSGAGEAHAVEWWKYLASPFPAYLMLAVFTPVLFRLSEAFPIERPRWRRSFAVHLAASLLFPAAHLWTSAAIATTLMSWKGSSGRVALSWAGVYYGIDIFRYWAIVGFYHALRFATRARHGEVEAQQLRTEAALLRAGLAEARLQNLARQLHPHFLFNALNVISGLALRRDPERAATLIARLSDLLRRSLRQEGPTTELREELELLDSYLQIERARLGERLQVTVDVDPELLHAEVPTLLLQPLVENSIRHGISRRRGRGTLEIRVWRAREEVWVGVWDNGPGFPRGGSVTADGGVGLANTRARLEQLYGGKAALWTANRPEGGAEVLVTLPLRTEPDPSCGEDGEAHPGGPAGAGRSASLAGYGRSPHCRRYSRSCAARSGGSPPASASTARSASGRRPPFQRSRARSTAARPATVRLAKGSAKESRRRRSRTPSQVKGTLASARSAMAR